MAATQTTFEFNEFDFVRLFYSVLILLKGRKEVNINDLETDLINYIKDENYESLFRNLQIKDNKIDLNSGFEMANNSNLFKIDNDQALEILTSYDDTRILSMTRLVTKMYSKTKEQGKVMTYKSQDKI